MKFGASRGQLYDAQKTARAKWEVATDTWDDETRRRHQEAVVEPLDQLVTNALRAIDQLAILVADVRRSVEYEE